MVLDGDLSVGALIVFILYLGKMYKPMQDLSKMTDTYSKAAVGYERIREVLETDSRVKDLPGARRRAPHFKGEIEFEHVNFGYSAGNPGAAQMSASRSNPDRWRPWWVRPARGRPPSSA